MPLPDEGVHGPCLSDIECDQFGSTRTAQIEEMHQEIDGMWEDVEQLEVRRKRHSAAWCAAHRSKGEVALDMR